MSSDRSLDAVGDSTFSRLFWIACVTEYLSAWVFLADASGYWAWTALPVPEAGSLGISRSCLLDSEQFVAAKAVPSVRVSWMSETAALLFVLLSGRSYHAAFSCFALRAPSIFVFAARQPLSCPPHASEIGEAYLISPSAVLGVDSPYRRLLPFPWIGPDCFPQTEIYLYWLILCELPRLSFRWIS